MQAIAIQNVRGGCGATSIAAGLAWALYQLGVHIVLVDCCAANDLRLFFDIDLDQKNGWARSILDGADWRTAVWRFVEGLDVLPFGAVGHDELSRLPVSATEDIVSSLLGGSNEGVAIFNMQQAGERAGVVQFDTRLFVTRPDMASYLKVVEGRLLQSHEKKQNDWILINQLRAESRLQQACKSLFLSDVPILSPVMMHYDEAMAESVAFKQPVGACCPDSLAADELRKLAIWLLSRQR